MRADALEVQVVVRLGEPSEGVDALEFTAALVGVQWQRDMAD